MIWVNLSLVTFLIPFLRIYAYDGSQAGVFAGMTHFYIGVCTK